MTPVLTDYIAALKDVLTRDDGWHYTSNKSDSKVSLCKEGCGKISIDFKRTSVDGYWKGFTKTFIIDQLQDIIKVIEKNAETIDDILDDITTIRFESPRGGVSVDMYEGCSSSAMDSALHKVLGAVLCVSIMKADEKTIKERIEEYFTWLEENVPYEIGTFVFANSDEFRITVYTPHDGGKDFFWDIESDELDEALEDICRQLDGFDPEEWVEMWLQYDGNCPDVFALVEDAKYIEKACQEIVHITSRYKHRNI